MNWQTTLRPDNKTGIKIQGDAYQVLKNGMVDLLKEQSMVCQLFFEILHKQFVDEWGENTGCYLYHVKLDLESRGVIRVERSKGKRSVSTTIKLAKNWQFLLTINPKPFL